MRISIMSTLSIFSYNNYNIRFEQRQGVVWVSLTDMAKATGKLVADWSRKKSTIEYLHSLETIMGIPITETIQGGTLSARNMGN